MPVPTPSAAEDTMSYVRRVFQQLMREGKSKDEAIATAYQEAAKYGMKLKRASMRS